MMCIAYEAWVAEATQASLKQKINRLVLVGVNPSSGDYQSIEAVVPNVKSLRIDLDMPDLAPFYHAGLLEQLEVDVADCVPIEFDQFSRLTTCRVGYRPSYSNVFNCLSLENLTLQGPECRDLSAIEKLTMLKTLDLIDCSVKELGGAGNLPNLAEIYVLDCRRLTLLPKFLYPGRIQKLSLFRCRQIENIPEAIAPLKWLRYLMLNDVGKIQTIQVLRNMFKLERLYLGGDTFILDGEVQFLRHLPSLQEVAGSQRRHYDDRFTAINEHAACRG
jgi:hypothetical protein